MERNGASAVLLFVIPWVYLDFLPFWGMFIKEFLEKLLTLLTLK